MNLFDYINAINKKNIKLENVDLKGYSKWMINRFFSCSPSLNILAVEINKYQNISEQQHFDFFYYGVPKNNNFLKYNASKQKEDEEILLIRKYYNINSSLAKEYLFLISKDELKKIKEISISKTGGENKKIKSK